MPKEWCQPVWDHRWYPDRAARIECEMAIKLKYGKDQVFSAFNRDEAPEERDDGAKDLRGGCRIRELLCLYDP